MTLRWPEEPPPPPDPPRPSLRQRFADPALVMGPVAVAVPLSIMAMAAGAPWHVAVGCGLLLVRGVRGVVRPVWGYTRGDEGRYKGPLEPSEAGLRRTRVEGAVMAVMAVGLLMYMIFR